MSINLIFLIISSLLAGTLISGLLYYKQRDYEGKGLIAVLFILRALAVALVLFVAIAPFISFKTKTQINPVIAVLVDNSSSMLSGADSSFVRTNLVSELNSTLSKVGDEVIEVIPFDAALNEKAIDFSGEVTDISNAIKSVKGRVPQDRLAAVVLVSDGINNRGTNPLYEVENDFLPIFTVGVGDTARQRDLAITSINAPKYVFRGDDILVNVTVAASNMDGEKPDLNLKQGSRTLRNQEVAINGQNFSAAYSFRIPTKKPGVFAYDIAISGIDGERNSRNNQTRFYVEVIDDRQEIVVVSGAPNADVAALREALRSVDAYEVKYQGLKQTPLISSKTALVVLFLQPGFQPTVYKNAVSKYTGSVWLIIDPLTDGRTVSGIYQELSLISNRRGGQTKAIVRNDFGLFKLTKETHNVLRKMPIVATTEGILQTNTPLEVLIEGSDKRPLAAYGAFNSSKIVVFNMGGLWRWRVHDFKENGTHQHIDEWLQATVQYLTSNSKKERFRLIYKERQLIGESVKVQAEVYDASFNISLEAEVELVITNQSGTRQQFDMLPNNGIYETTLNGLYSGSHQITATAKLGSETLNAKGEFLIEDLGLEDLNTRADFGLLQQMAVASGGVFYTAENLNQLGIELQKRSIGSPIERITTNTMPLVDLLWLLFIAVGLLTAEWLLRRYYGRI